VTTYDQARQFGKVYVGALNTSLAAFEDLFAEDALLRVGGGPASPADVFRVAPPGRSSYRGVRLQGEGFLVTVRVRERTEVDDLAHRLVLGGDGRIVVLEA
jgi:hypothetical protein